MLKKFTNWEEVKKTNFLIILSIGIAFVFVCTYLKLAFIVKMGLSLAALIWAFVGDIKYRIIYAIVVGILFQVFLFSFKLPEHSLTVRYFGSGDIIVIIFVCISIMHFILHKIYSYRMVSSFAIFLLIWSGIFCLILSTQKRYQLIYLSYMFTGYVLYKYIVSLPYNNDFIKGYVRLLSYLALMISLYSLYQWIQSGLFGRPFGVFAHPNCLSGFLSFVFPLTFVYSLSEKKYIYLLFIPFYLCTILLSYSRSGYLALLISTLMMFYLLFFILNKKGCLLLALIFLPGLVALFLYKPVFLRFLSIAAINTDPAIQFRFMFWKLAIKKFLLSPLWGLGENATEIYRRTGVAFEHVHNLYLELLSRGGLIGLGGFLLLIGKLMKGLKTIFLEKKYTSFLRYISAGLFCAWISVLVHSFFDVSWFEAADPTLLRLFWINCGI